MLLSRAEMVLPSQACTWMKSLASPRMPMRMKLYEPVLTGLKPLTFISMLPVFS